MLPVQLWPCRRQIPCEGLHPITVADHLFVCHQKNPFLPVSCEMDRPHAIDARPLTLPINTYSYSFKQPKPVRAVPMMYSTGTRIDTITLYEAEPPNDVATFGSALYELSGRWRPGRST